MSRTRAVRAVPSWAVLAICCAAQFMVVLLGMTAQAPDLVGRDFPAATVNQKWYADGTEIATDEGKRHLASVLDMGSRRLVGFAFSEHHDAELTCAALAMAVAIRGSKEAIAGVVFHTDEGSEYTARSFRLVWPD